MTEKKNQTYDEALAELEQLIARLQQPDCAVEQLQALTERGLALIRQCRAQLLETDAVLQQLMDSFNENEK